MRLFQINVSRTANSGKTAHYYKMSTYDVVIQKMNQLVSEGEIFDFEVIV